MPEAHRCCGWAAMLGLALLVQQQGSSCHCACGPASETAARFVTRGTTRHKGGAQHAEEGPALDTALLLPLLLVSSIDRSAGRDIICVLE